MSKINKVKDLVIFCNEKYAMLMNEINKDLTLNFTTPCGYILDDKKNIKACYDLSELSDFIKQPFYTTRRVDQTQIENYRIYTSFLTQDHNCSLTDDRPVCFETMIKRNENFLEYQKRYRTWNEAVAGHNKTCNLVRRWIEKRKAKEQTP